MHDRTAIVIGAGAAGLSAASALLAAGVKVTLLEASSRIGGRCCTTTYSFGAQEAGATWLHGAKGNPAFALCDAAGLVPRRPPKNKNTPKYLRSDGHRTDIPAVRAVARVLHDAVEEVDDGRPRTGAQSLGEHVRGAWAEARPQLLARHGDAVLLDAAWRAAELLQCAIDGCGDLADADVGPAYANYDDFDGKNVPSRADLGGFSAAMEHLAAPLLREDVLRLGSAAHTVQWGGGGAEVVLADGTTLRADAVCVTVPLEPLRAMVFDPPLPASTSEAMGLLALGQVEKVFVTFEKTKAHAVASAAPAEAEDDDGECPTLHLLWAHDAAVDDTDNWCRSLYSLHAPSRYGPAADAAALPRRSTLVGWLTGESARRVSGRAPAELLGELRTGLAPFWRQLDGWRPVDVCATSWCTHANYGGAYTYARPGAPADVATRLAAPLVGADGVPRVCFAGEATSEACMGTVAGAMLSGEREASRLLRAWGLAPADADDASGVIVALEDGDGIEVSYDSD